MAQVHTDNEVLDLFQIHRNFAVHNQATYSLPIQKRVRKVATIIELMVIVLARGSILNRLHKKSRYNLHCSLDNASVYLLLPNGPAGMCYLIELITKKDCSLTFLALNLVTFLPLRLIVLTIYLRSTDQCRLVEIEATWAE